MRKVFLLLIAIFIAIMATIAFSSCDTSGSNESNGSQNENGSLFSGVSESNRVGTETTDEKWFSFYLLDDGTYSVARCSDYDKATYPSDIVIPDTYNGKPVTEIRDYQNSDRGAFEKCTTIKSVVIPDSVIDIGYNAFTYCENLQSVKFGKGVERISGEAFLECIKLDNLEVDPKNECYYSVDNCVIAGQIGEGEGRLALGSNKSVIPNDGSIVGIERGAFYGRVELKEVYIPEGVKYIGECAFPGCAFSSINIPSSVESIGEYAFWWCENLTEITIPDSVETIAEGVFEGCLRLEKVSLGNEVALIAYHAFFKCMSLSDIKIPNSVKYVDSKAFSYCSENILKNENGITYVDTWAIQADSDVTTGIIKDGTIGVANETFGLCESLTSVKIPASVEHIGWSSFFCYWSNEGCSNKLETIEVAPENKNYSSTGNCIIDKNTKELILGCNNTVIPTDGQVLTIGQYSFSRCKDLTDIAIPDCVTKIAGGAFEGCDKSIESEDGLYYVDNWVVGMSGEYAREPFSSKIRPGTIGIAEWSSYSSNLESITIPSGLMYINDNYAFEHIKYIFFEGTREEWNSIIKERNIPEDRVIFINEALNTATEAKWFKFELLDDETYSVAKCDDYGQSTYPIIVIIPNEYNGKAVTKIADRGFKNCSGIKYLVLPGSITSIGFEAFYGCRNLSDVTIPDGVTDICDSAFRNCSDLKNLTISNSVVNIGYAAFSECALTKVVIPDSVEEIGGNAFERCSITDVFIGKSVKTIGNEAFIVNALEKIEVSSENEFYFSENNCLIERKTNILVLGCKNSIISNGVVSIGFAAFVDCFGLTNITLPEGVLSIEESAFSGCSGLTSITIPDGVISIRAYAFFGCGNLTSVIFEGTMEQWNAIEKGPDIFTDTQVTKIICSDGEVLLG